MILSMSPNTRPAPPGRLMLATCCLIFSVSTFAEGAVRTFDCSLQLQCDADGECTPETGKVTFQLEPQLLDAQGAGSYRLVYEDEDVAMQAVSDAGPFTWTLAGVRHTLLVNAADGLLWHQLEFSAAPKATTHRLNCNFSQ